MIDAAKTSANLYHCLDLVLRLFRKKKTVKEILSGLPVEGQALSLKVFLRAVERAGIGARIEKLPLQKLLDQALPSIIFLSGNELVFCAKVLKRGKKIRALSVDGNAAELTISRKQLKASYLGYAITIGHRRDLPENPESGQDSESHGWFWRVFFKSWRIYRDVLLASFLINVFALTSPLFIMNVYDRVVPNNAIETLWVLLAGVLIIFAFDLVLRVLRGYFVDISGRRADTELSAMLYQHVLGIRMANRPASVGAFANNLDEFESIRNFITSATVTTLIDLPFVFLFLFVIWYVGGTLVMVPVIVIPLILVYALVAQPGIKRTSQQVAQAAARKNATLVESLVGIETVKLLGAESRQQHKWEQAIEDISLWSVRSRLLSASVVSVAIFLQQMATIGVVAYGVYLIAEGSLSLGGLIAAVILTSRVLAPMAQVASLATHYHRAVSAMKTITTILNLPVERNSEKEYLVLPKIRGEVEFEKVSFSYPGQAIPALDNVSLKIQAGERVGIIGRTGSGKSTIGKLVAGLYRENSGFVRVDGIDVRQLDHAELRGNIGYVPQDVTLFGASMRDNILFGDDSATDDQLIKAAELSDAISIVRQHPSGFDMAVGERGLSLSGGQRQAVAIARAILNDPPVVIMDEPTNSMDNLSESILKRNLKNYLKNKTFILITHKTSMLDLVDRLIVIDKGRVIANGNKQDVIKALQSIPKAS
ncbi:MAG: type I secretion system permease/ATPase [Gammaproteobacteria bacterium]|nr:type I secretion system permease/ATPase [Gammaproteobacteria bacterium]